MSQLSRSGITHPLGSMTAEFPKFKGPEETHELATRMVRVVAGIGGDRGSNA